MSAPVVPVLYRRAAWVDQTRGLAIVLMVLDHALVITAPGHVLRYTVTRFALPLFLAMAATVYRGAIRRRRWLELGAVASTEVLVRPVLDLGLPGPVGQFLLVYALAPAIARRPYLLAMVGLIQALYLPLPHDLWSGYQPGLLVAWFGLAILGAHQLEPIGRRLPGWLAGLGRYPLHAYAVHLAALVVWAGVLR